MTPQRYKESLAVQPTKKIPLFAALKEKLKEGYTVKDLRADIMSGIIVGLVAIPLGMALAIASDTAPQYGLYTVITAGFLVALFGGSRFQVTGPTAAFVVILVPIVHKFGLAGLLVAGCMAGIILLFMGLFRLGHYIEFIPHPVITGFTAGIAVVIATIQLKDFFGLYVEKMPETYLQRVAALVRAYHTMVPAEFFVGLATLVLLVVWPKVNKKIPAPLVVLSFITIAVVILKKILPDFAVATVGSKFGLPSGLPHIQLPWFFHGANDPSFVFDFNMVQALIPASFAVAMLGAIESLLSAVVADGMAQTKHDPDAELIALGIGNILCPFAGGIPATGAIARTATNIRFGAKSPFSAMIHAVFVLLVVICLSPYVAQMPMAALAALLILVAYNMSDIRHVFYMLRVAPKSDIAVFLVCFFFTVVFDMVIGVGVGIVFASLLFIKRMESITFGKVIFHESQHPKITVSVPKHILVYEIAGPLFFGAAKKAVSAITEITDNIETVIFIMDEVSVMDVTGLVAFEGTIQRLLKFKKNIILVAVEQQPLALLNKAKILENDRIKIYNDLPTAIAAAGDKKATNT